MEKEQMYNYGTEEVKDSTLNEGTRIVTSSGVNGCKASGYLVTYQNGVQINKELISTDIYTAKNQVVSVGTKKAQEQTPVEAKPGQDNQEQVVPQ
jgi:uncharacterized protein YabE (DUF348 family)